MHLEDGETAKLPIKRLYIFPERRWNIWTANLLRYQKWQSFDNYIYLPWKEMEKFGLQICYTTEMT